MDTSFPGWKSVRPESDGESFTERSGARREIFERATRTRGPLERNPLLWTFFQIADVEQVRASFENEQAWAVMKMFVSQPGAALVVDVVRLWKQNLEAKNKTTNGISSMAPSSSNATPTSTPRPSTATIDDGRTRSKRKRGG
ncbi:hypothetical protein G6011_11511 [Alternaria panax]|uniref:Uncharacterized protein n=1 Tax=Alternaria panax TaxID=48097 RepID=A0AAD4IDJ3_9PLEO|nr:hypothetical protein G6011_11511 [Alternaria panax]